MALNLRRRRKHCCGDTHNVPESPPGATVRCADCGERFIVGETGLLPVGAPPEDLIRLSLGR